MWAFDPECYDVLGIVFSLPTTPTYGSCIIPPLQIWKLRLKVTGHAQIHRARQEVKELRFEAKSASLQTLLLTILTASQHTSPPFLSTPPGWQKPQRSRESLMQIQIEWTYSSGMALLVQLVEPNHSALPASQTKATLPSFLSAISRQKASPPTNNNQSKERSETQEQFFYCTSEK